MIAVTFLWAVRLVAPVLVAADAAVSPSSPAAVTAVEAAPPQPSPAPQTPSTPTPAPAASTGGAPSSAGPTSQAAPATSVEDEVLANVKAQPVGPASTVADMAFSDAYLRRVSDRIVRATFEGRYRRVLPDDVISAASKSPVQPDSHPATKADGTQASSNRAWIVGGVVAAVLAGLYVLSRRGSSAPTAAAPSAPTSTSTQPSRSTKPGKSTNSPGRKGGGA